MASKIFFSHQKVYFWISAFDHRAIVLDKMHIVHWRSMDKSCSFCAINYTVISTMDTFAEDYAHISERLGLTRVKAERSNVHGGSKIEKLTTEHFKEVPEGVKQKLREI